MVSVLSLFVRFAPTHRKFFSRAIFFRRTYGQMEDIPVPEGLSCAWASTEDIELIDKHPEATSRGANTRRVARGDRCMRLKRGDEILGYQWVTRQAACVFCGFDPGYELLFFPLQADQIFTYDSYVYSAHRRKAYGTVIRRRLHRTLQHEGIREAYSLVAPENTPSISITLQSGFEPWRMAYGVRIRGWSKMILGPEVEPRLLRWIDEFKAHTVIDMSRFA